MAQSRTISERPRTAGAGSTTSFSRPWTANKPFTNGLGLRIPSQTMTYREGSQLFLFPSPSPGQQLPRSATFPTTSMLSNSPTTSPRIGIALGSPSQALDLSQVNREKPQKTRLPVQPPPIRPPPGPPKQQANEACPAQAQPKRKKTNWKIFKDMFNRKESKPVANEPLSQLGLLLDRPSTSSGSCLRDLPLDGEETLLLRVVNGRVESNTTMSRSEARLMARAEADVANIRRNQRNPIRNPSSPHVNEFQPCFDFAEIEKGLDDVICKEIELDRRDSPMSDTNDSVFNGSPHLDLHIPDPIMDRYSVMFENLLVVDGPKMSLLERRRTKMLHQNPSTQLDPISNPTQNDVISRDGFASPRSARLPMLSPLRLKSNGGATIKTITTEKTKSSTNSTSTHHHNNLLAPSIITKEDISPIKLSPRSNFPSKSTPDIISTTKTTTTKTSTSTLSHISTTHLIVLDPAINRSTLSIRNSATMTNNKDIILSSATSPLPTPCSISPCLNSPRTPLSPHLLRFRTRTPESPVLVSVAKQVSLARTTLRRVQECLPSATGTVTGTKKSLVPRVVQLGKDRAKTNALVS